MLGIKIFRIDKNVSVTAGTGPAAATMLGAQFFANVANTEFNRMRDLAQTNFVTTCCRRF